MKDLRERILSVVTNNPWMASTDIAKSIPEANPARAQEMVSRMWPEQLTRKRGKDYKFLYAPASLVQKEKDSKAVAKAEDPQEFSEYIIQVRRKNHEFRKGADNNVDLNAHLETLLPDDQVAVYRKIEVHKKTIFQIKE